MDIMNFSDETLQLIVKLRDLYISKDDLSSELNDLRDEEDLIKTGIIKVTLDEFRKHRNEIKLLILKIDHTDILIEDCKKELVASNSIFSVPLVASRDCILNYCSEYIDNM